MRDVFYVRHPQQKKINHGDTEDTEKKELSTDDG